MPTLTIKSDKPMMLVSVEEFESMKETIDVLSDKALLKVIEQGRQEFAEGKTIKLSDLRQKRARN